MKRRICEFVTQVEGTRCMHVTASVDDVERESPGQLLMNSWAEHTNYQLGTLRLSHTSDVSKKIRRTK